ncbi:hypothetical protein SAMN02745857_01039 [Andreprevotia lacus DSM 23236]|jgi:hypothetical protein|uniref:Uncharacterized protein n=1 Tax=Andreprevotia lacus DSM 23236 TaxID=1121001 RepID=A0A1W1XAA1_9NEIS|nr:hypothetical protein [Andreprevotia lacus]SMC20757.1 hypothetical protein SAMN02745857_01039 [Andreprevotia lacus DSM 23236]
MKKFIALGLLLCGMMSNAFAETRYYEVTSGGGQSYCDAVWPGSQYNGVRQGWNNFYFVACMKN